MQLPAVPGAAVLATLAGEAVEALGRGCFELRRLLELPELAIDLLSAKVLRAGGIEALHLSSASQACKEINLQLCPTLHRHLHVSKPPGPPPAPPRLWLPIQRDAPASIGIVRKTFGCRDRVVAAVVFRAVRQEDNGGAHLPGPGVAHQSLPGALLGDEMNPKRVYGSYSLVGIIVV